jgi:hypothetical protein
VFQNNKTKTDERTYVRPPVRSSSLPWYLGPLSKKQSGGEFVVLTHEFKHTPHAEAAVTTSTTTAVPAVSATDMGAKAVLFAVLLLEYLARFAFSTLGVDKMRLLQ